MTSGTSENPSERDYWGRRINKGTGDRRRRK
jgi:hypothetical protein